MSHRNVCAIKRCINVFAGLLPLSLTSVTLVCVTISHNELWGQPVQGVEAAESLALDDPNKINWLSENAIPIRSIDPGDDDFADLMLFKSLLDGVRVVMLGEASHGDGAAFYAKQRLVRFLHEEMRFDVLAWEARFFAMEEMNRALESGRPISIDSAWAEGVVMKPIYEYSRVTHKTDRPLLHTGVDIRFGVPIAKWADCYRKRLVEFLQAGGPDPVSLPDIRTINEFLLTLQKPPYSPSEEERIEVRSAIERVRHNLMKKAGSVQNSREIKYFAKTLDDLLACEEHIILCNYNTIPPKNMLSRSRKMAENLIWLVNEWYPEQKIIVWAHNQHVARNLSSTERVHPRIRLPHMEFVEMGDYVHDELGKSMYSIAFVTYQGTRSREENKSKSVESVSGSIQSLWHHTGYLFSFLDFRSVPGEHWFYGPQLAYISGSALECAIWPNVFDGMFYIDTMFPYALSGEVPEGVHTRKR